MNPTLNVLNTQVLDASIGEVLNVVKDNFSALETVVKNKDMNKVKEPFNPTQLAPDFSDAYTFFNIVGITDPVFNRLHKTFEQSRVSRWVRDETTGKYVFKSYRWNTTTPTDNGTDCCFIPQELNACQVEGTGVDYLCLQDCEDRLDYLMNLKGGYESNDLTNYFERLGWNYEQARDFLARCSFAFYTIRTAMISDPTATGNGLRPFNSLAYLMSNAQVIAFNGANPLVAFKMLARRLMFIREYGSTETNQTSYFFALHPLTLAGLSDHVKKDKFGNYPDGWVVGADGMVTSYNGIPFVTSLYIPVDDKTSSTGTIYVIDSSTTEIVLNYPALVPDQAVRDLPEVIAAGANGCEYQCKKYENFGTGLSLDYNRLMVITGVPLSLLDMGMTLQGFDEIITPTTMFPRYEVAKPAPTAPTATVSGDATAGWTIKGKTTAGADVTAKDGSTTVGTAKASSTGDYTITLTTKPAAGTDITVTAKLNGQDSKPTTVKLA